MTGGRKEDDRKRMIKKEESRGVEKLQWVTAGGLCTQVSCERARQCYIDRSPEREGE